MGGRLLRRWLGRPLLDIDRINERLDAVETLVDEADLRARVRDTLRGMGDLERWINRITQGRALPRDLLGVREVLRRGPGLRELVLGAKPASALGMEDQAAPRTAAEAFFRQMLDRLPDCTPSLEFAGAGDRR